MDATAPAAPDEAMIRLDRVSKRYEGGGTAVEQLSLEVPEGKICVLVGPSGCGKTTTMKMINRLVEPSSGRIFLRGEDVTAVNPVALRRRIGYVIQQVGLFPHLTVHDNVATVPRLLRWSRARADERAQELLALVGLEPGVYAKRYPSQLSGGQRQRVGVARALAADPDVLLMDEPFSAIDPIARKRLQGEFLRLQAEVQKTVVFVTHDIDEAVRMGDRIAVLREGGVLEQYADPATLLGAPGTPFVAEFVGADRGLTRLSVTPIATNDLEQPPVARTGDRLAVARWEMESSKVPWVVVLDGDGGLRGWLPRERASGDGLVGERTLEPPDPLPADGSLREAMSRLLRSDDAWLPVVAAPGGRYLGVLTPSSVHASLRRSVQDAPVDSGYVRTDDAVTPAAE